MARRALTLTEADLLWTNRICYSVRWIQRRPRFYDLMFRRGTPCVAADPSKYRVDVPTLVIHGNEHISETYR